MNTEAESPTTQPPTPASADPQVSKNQYAQRKLQLELLSMQVRMGEGDIVDFVLGKI